MPGVEYVTAWLRADEQFILRGKVMDNAEWVRSEKRRLESKGIKCTIVKDGRRVALKRSEAGNEI